MNEKLELTLNHWILSLSTLIPIMAVAVTNNVVFLLITPIGLLIDFFYKKSQLNNLSERFLQVMRILAVFALICDLFVMFFYAKQIENSFTQYAQVTCCILHDLVQLVKSIKS